MLDLIEERALKAKLTAKDKKVLDYLLQNKETYCCFETSGEIAQKLKVSPSCVVRLSAKLGFESFSQLKRVMQEELCKNRAGVKIPYEKIGQYENLTDEQRIAAIRQNVIANIQRDQQIETSRLIEGANLLFNAKRIFVVGHRCVAGFAQSFGVMLSCIRPHFQVVNGALPMVDTLSDLNEKDVLVAIAFERYSSPTVFAVKMAKEAHAKVIAMTDSYVSPIAQGAAVTLVSSTENFSFYNSYASLEMNIEILVGLLSARNKKQNEERLKKMEQYLSENGEY